MEDIVRDLVEFNLADLFEAVADAVPERTALIAADIRLSYRDLDERATRLARHLVASGIAPGDFIGMHAWNRAEWIEAMIDIHKARAVPIDINHRYVENELRYLFDNCAMTALVVERSTLPLICALAPDFPERRLIVLEDGTPADPLSHPLDARTYESALAEADTDRGALIAATGTRSDDDLYGLYTGGTTGMPKCGLWRGSTPASAW
jgi:3-oxocholest-4-en-26-oate---CoA ligase